MISEVYIKKDERNAILVTPDNFKGLVVQVVRFSSQLRPNSSNELIEHRTRHALWSKTVSTMSTSNMNSLLANPSAPSNPKDGVEFKNEINKVIEEAKSYLSKINFLDQMVDGSMNDYLSQNRDINKE